MSQGQGQSWVTRFPVYQIDFQVVETGKMIASSKRKMRWRFGFPNKQALDAGRTGVDCRGEEHDIAIIWSITSGKRQVYMDGTEIHFSTSRAGTFQYSWSARGNHVIKVIAHAAPPMQPIPGFRQYDLFVDGQSFFNMPKAYELGLRGPVGSPSRVPGVQGYAQGYGNTYGRSSAPTSPSGLQPPRSREEEDLDLQRAINASLNESRKFLATKEVQPEVRSAPAPTMEDLMDFAGQPGIPSQPSFPDSQSVTSWNSMPSSYGAPPPGQYAPPPAYSQQNLPPAYNQPNAPHAYNQQNAGYASQPPYQSPPQGYPSTTPGYPSTTPGYQAPPLAHQAPPPAASNALVLSGAPSQQYALPPAAPTYQPPAPAAPAASVYGAPPPPQPAAPPSFYGAPSSAASVTTQYGAAPPAYGAPSPQAVPTGDLFAPPPVDPFAPQPPVATSRDPYGLSQPACDDPFAPRPPPPPTRDDITKSILNAYGAPPSQQQHPGGHPQQPGGQPSPTQNGGQHATTNGAITNGPILSINGGYSAGVEEPEEKPLSELEKAMKKLVNIERIDEPAEEEYKVTLKKKEEEKKRKDGKSKGLPPVATGLVGSNATLEHIKQVKPDTPKTGEGVMRAPPQLFHPDAVNAGALTVYGQGPPPIQRGFGVGYGPPPTNFQRW